MTETLLDPELGHAHATNKTAFNKAHNVDEDYWSWLERPDNRLRLARFGAAMNGLGNMTPKDTILEGLIMLRDLAEHQQILKFRHGRVRMGNPPPGFADRRCWRWGGLAVVGARYTLSSASLRGSGPRACRGGCSRGT